MSTRPGSGLHVRITDNIERMGVRQAYTITYEGIVASPADQPPNGSLVALSPVDGKGGLVNVAFGKPPKGSGIARDLEIVGWPVGMIALWNAYDPNHLREVFVDQAFRWDGEVWVPLDYKSGLLIHDGKSYDVIEAGDYRCTATLTMGAVIWDGVVPR